MLMDLAAERPNDPDIPLWLAEALLASGDYPAALARFRTMLEASFEQPRRWENFINAAAGMKVLPREHLPLLRRIAERATREIAQPEVLSRLAYILLQNGEKPLAQPLLDRAIALKPADAAPRIEIAGVLALAGRYRDALAMYGRVPLAQQDPLRLVTLYAALEDWPMAEKLCWSALQQTPDNRELWRWLADVLSWKGDYERSLEWFAKLLRDKPDDADLLTRIAEVTLWSGNAAAALPKFDALLQRSFENPRLWAGYLAAAANAGQLDQDNLRLISRINDRFNESDATAEKLHSDSLFIAHLAHALARSGSTAQAESLFARALELPARDLTERKQLAGILAGAKKYKECLRYSIGFPSIPMSVCV